MTVSRNFARLRSAQRLRALRFRFAKFVPFAFVALFFAMNFTGLLGHVLAPEVNAAQQVEIIPLDIPVSGDCELDWIIFRAGEREGVDPRFIHAVIKQESGYKADAVSPAGARGLMQLMPATAKRFGNTDPDDTASNIEAWTKYLAWLLKRSKVILPIPGTSSIKHLEENIAAASLELPQEAYDELSEVSLPATGVRE